MYLWKWVEITLFFMGFWKSRSEHIQILTDIITSGGRKSNGAKLFVLECQLKCFPYWGFWSRSFTSSTDNEEVCGTMSSLYKWLLALCLFLLAHRWRGWLTFQQRVNCILPKMQRKQKGGGINVCVWWRCLWLWHCEHSCGVFSLANDTFSFSYYWHLTSAQTLKPIGSLRLAQRQELPEVSKCYLKLVLLWAEGWTRWSLQFPASLQNYMVSSVAWGNQGNDACARHICFPGERDGFWIFSHSLLPPSIFHPYLCSAFTVGGGEMNPRRALSQMLSLFFYFLLAGRWPFFYPWLSSSWSHKTGRGCSPRGALPHSPRSHCGVMWWHWLPSLWWHTWSGLCCLPSLSTGCEGSHPLNLPQSVSRVGQDSEHRRLDRMVLTGKLWITFWGFISPPHH